MWLCSIPYATDIYMMEFCQSILAIVVTRNVLFLFCLNDITWFTHIMSYGEHNVKEVHQRNYRKWLKTCDYSEAKTLMVREFVS